MNKVCFIGNSHLAAVKLGTEQARSAGLVDIDVDFFGAHADALGNCVVRGGEVLPNNDLTKKTFLWTSGGLESISLNKYSDIFVFAGLPPYLPSLYLSSFEPQPIGRPLVKAVVDSWAGHWGSRFTSKIAAECRGRVHFVGPPFPASSSAFARGMTVRLEGSARARILLKDLKRKINDEVDARNGINFYIMSPLKKCMDKYGISTKEKYSRGSVKLTVGLTSGHTTDDVFHMNGDYGQALIENLFPTH